MTAPGAGALLALTMATLLVAPAQADEASAERQRLATQRAAIESRYRAEEAACRDHFVVTPCVEAARAERRQALAQVREQELKLDDVERRERARVRREAIADKRAQAAAHAASAATAAASAPGDGRAPRPALAASSAAHAAPAASRAPLDADGATAAARAARSTDKRQQAAERRVRIEQRQRERAARTQGGVKGAPLPAASAASR